MGFKHIFFFHASLRKFPFSHFHQATFIKINDPKTFRHKVILMEKYYRLFH
jgi:hypothetical protein